MVDDTPTPLTAEVDFKQLLPIVESVAEMRGMLLAMQNDLKHSQTYTTSALAKVEGLEKKQFDLESRMVTRDDLAALMVKVDTLISSDASRKGATNVATWSITNLVPYLALLVALLALVDANLGRNEVIQETIRQQTEAKP
jgi:hypothetical protein